MTDNSKEELDELKRLLRKEQACMEDYRDGNYKCDIKFEKWMESIVELRDYFKFLIKDDGGSE